MPAIIGLPALAAFLGSLLLRMVQVFFNQKVIRLGIILGFAAALYAAMKVLDGVVTGHIKSLLAGMPSEINYLGMLLPSNTASCIQACLSTQFACITYAFVHKGVMIKMRAAG